MRVPQPSSDPADDAAIARVASELAALRRDVAVLAAENAALRANLERSESARSDLFAQVRHVLELLAQSRREVWSLQARVPR